MTATLLAGAAPALAAPPATPTAKPDESAAATDKAFFDPHTKIVPGDALQVVFGERAVFELGDKGQPLLSSVEKGKLAIAHPPGAVKESYAKPAAGKLAAALDGSKEKRASYLKVWNGLDHPVSYRAGVLKLVGGRLVPATVKVCAVPAGGVSYETWKEPVMAVALARFAKADDDKSCK